MVMRADTFLFWSQERRTLEMLVLLLVVAVSIHF